MSDKEKMWYPEFNPSGYRELNHEMLLKNFRAGMWNVTVTVAIHLY